MNLEEAAARRALDQAADWLESPAWAKHPYPISIRLMLVFLSIVRPQAITASAYKSAADEIRKIDASQFCSDD